jgi:hypothetical protein
MTRSQFPLLVLHCLRSLAFTVSPAPTTVHFAKHGAVSYKASDLNGGEKPAGNQLGEIPMVRRFPTGGDRTPSWRVLRWPPFG